MIDLSFVIIGKNAQWSIARLLDSVITHAPPRLATEIIYVDSASTDRTIEIVSRYPATIIQLSASQPLCASAGRYTGTQYATARYICFLDSDMELLDGWLERALKVMDESLEIAAITGIVVDTDSTLTADSILPIDYSSYHGAKLTGRKSLGGAVLFRRSALIQVGSWNPYIISEEEPELCLRIRHAGHRVVRLEYPMARHYTTPVLAFSTLFARRKRGLYLGQGQTIRYYLRNRLLLPYLMQDRYLVTNSCAVLLAIASGVLSWATMNGLWLLCFLGPLAIVIVLDAIRTRSFYRPLFRLISRVVILEGTIRGFLMHPNCPGEFTGDVTFVRRADDILAAANAPFRPM